MRSLLFVVLATASLAHAEPVASTAARTPLKVGIAVNPPIRWFDDHDSTFAASIYAAIDEHQVVRGNFARYPYGPSLLAGLESEGAWDGNVTDFGASYQYYPRRAYDGVVVEAGLLVRSSVGTAYDPFESDETSEDTKFIAGRAMIGWSWLVADHLFTSLQVGGSVGYKRGTTSVCGDACQYDGMPPVTTRIAEPSIAPEIMMRIGFALDL